MVVEDAKNKQVFQQSFSRGKPLGPIEKIGAAPNRRGTTVTFHPDAQIFGSHQFKPSRLMKMARSKAYLFSGVEIRWKSQIPDGDMPMEATFHFPGGLADYLSDTLEKTTTYADRPCAGKVGFQEKFGVPGSVEWAINWSPVRDGFIQSYTNTVPTPEGGTHEAGFWAAILKGIRAYGDLVKNRKSELITREDLLTGGCALVSCFIREPQFVGQTKDRLATEEAAKWVEGAVRDHFDNWLANDTKSAGAIQVSFTSPTFGPGTAAGDVGEPGVVDAPAMLAAIRIIPVPMSVARPMTNLEKRLSLFWLSFTTPPFDIYFKPLNAPFLPLRVGRRKGQCLILHNYKYQIITSTI